MTTRTRLITTAVVVLLIALVAGTGSAAARARTVTIPRVSGNLSGVYATLHRDGLTVTIAHPFTLRSDRITQVTAIQPTAGHRVRRGSAVTVTVRCCQSVGHVIRYGATRSTVPTVDGYGLATARNWATGAQRRFFARLTAIRRANANSLLANFVVTRQSPGANSTLGGSSPLSVSARPGRPAACLPPLYGSVVASDALASVSAVTGTESAINGATGPGASYYGCVASVNRLVHLTTTVSGDNYDYTLGKPVIAGTLMAAVTATGGGKYGPGPETFALKLWDLGSGHPTTVYTSGSDFIDQPVLNDSGDTAWHVVSLPANAATAFNEISCPTTSFCAAVDQAGSVFTSTNPTGGRSAWSQAQLTTASMSGISCPTAALCVATSGGDAFVSTTPTVAASWTQVRIAPMNVTSVACPSTTLCVAVTASGVATTTNPTGPAGGWQYASVPGAPHGLNDVVCPSTSLCAASDGGYGNVATTTNPSGGAATWSLADIDGSSALTGIGCASASLCVAGDGSGDVLSSTNPAGGLPAWQLSHAASTFFSHFSCPSTSLCAAGAPSAVLTSTNPTSSNPWSVAPINGTGMVNGISCPSTGLCVAVDNLGQVLTATDPTGGGAGWSVAVVDAPACAGSTGCKTERILAHDLDGVRTLDITGPGDGTQLTGLTLTGKQVTWTHDGNRESAVLK